MESELTTDGTTPTKVKKKTIRTKKRRVKHALKVVVECNGHKHDILYTPKGHIVLAHHPDIDLEAEMAMVALGSENCCRCAGFLAEWREGKIPFVGFTSFVPWVMDGVRNTKDYRVGLQCYRAWRKYARKMKYNFKQTKEVIPPWPATFAEFKDYIKIKLKQIGILLSDTGSTSDDICLYTACPTITNSSSKITKTVRVELTKTDNGKFCLFSTSVPGLGIKRQVTKSNLPVLIDLIGRYVYESTKKCVISPTNIYYKKRLDDIQTYINHTEIVDYSTFKKVELDSYLSWNIDKYSGILELNIAFELDQVTQIPYMSKKLNDMLSIVNKAYEDKLEKLKALGYTRDEDPA